MAKNRSGHKKRRIFIDHSPACHGRCEYSDTVRSWPRMFAVIGKIAGGAVGLDLVQIPASELRI